MSLEGRLEDLSLPDIFQIINLSKRSGVLTIIRKEGTARLVFDQGQVVIASSDTRSRLGYLLVQKGLITNEELDKALYIQKTKGGEQPIGSYLIEINAIQQSLLEKEIKEHIIRIIGDLLTWERGTFHFELGETLKESDIPLRTGLSIDFLLLESARIHDEEEEERRQEEAQKKIETKKEKDRAEKDKDNKDMSLLTSMITELSSPSSTSNEITLMILRFASEIMNRSVIFLVRKEDVIGLGQFGVVLKSGSINEKIRMINIPLSEPSIFKDVIEKRIPYKGELPDNKWNSYLIKELGGDWPVEAFIAPLITNKKIAAILYGDNLPRRDRISHTNGLETFIKVAGVYFEKALLEKKIQGGSF
ncbi:MAG: DUF4388 domain-containing protein [Nitrospirota bacterium]